MTALKHGSNLKLSQGYPFAYTWPDEHEAKFRDVTEGSVQTDSGVHTVKIGFTTWESAERERERAVVFIDGRPLLQFTAADDYERSKQMASVIKTSMRQIRPTEEVPAAFKHLTIGIYNEYVSGRYASSNRAVICDKSDLESMVEHALLRMQDIEGRS